MLKKNLSKFMKIFIAMLFIVINFLAQTGQVFAADLPNFTSCLNPQGEVKANYETGTHGIVGNGSSFQGKDTVYSLSGDALTQCFCATDGSGIQTNWLNTSNLSESEIKVLKSQGWIYVPNGALWGLEQAPYLALNSDYSCKSSSGGNGENSGSSDNGSVSGSSSSGSSNNSGNNSGRGSVSGGSGGVGQVLGLASTGNNIFLLATSAVSGLSLLTGLILKKRNKKVSKE